MSPPTEKISDVLPSVAARLLRGRMSRNIGLPSDDPFYPVVVCDDGEARH